MTCDHCGASLLIHRDGWYVGMDQKRTCPKNPTGHEVEGHPRD